MDFETYAAKYGGPQAELLRDLGRVKGSRMANHDYKRAAQTALMGFGIDRLDAYWIAHALSAEQIRRLGEHVALQEEEAEPTPAELIREQARRKGKRRV